MTSSPEELRVEEFSDFVHEVRGHRPFPWQAAYVQQVAETGIWPDLDVPTGLGKTGIIDIWAFLLAWQSVGRAARTVPLRLFFTVDRRLVVDQAFNSAQGLRRALAAGAPGTVAGRVACALTGLGGTDEALACVRMRGGADWASRWLRSPAQPAVITSTVDQYGSRLLFRGYGTSARMRPIDAALCGIDSLLAVDEAHISVPLLVTATDCAAYQATATHPVFAERAVKVISLSATAACGADRPRLGITAADQAHPVAGRRLNAERRLTLLDATSGAKDAGTAFARATEAALGALLLVVERPVIGVVANTIRAARATFELLARREDIDVMLLTGRSRSLDREYLLDSPLVTELLAGVSPDRAKPLVVVATQTIEVGVDITFAALITENAALSALIQRLGRLDRTGELSLAPAIVIRASADTGHTSIPVYGTAAEHTWHWLATNALPLSVDGLTAEQLSEAMPGGLLVNPLTLPGLLSDIDTGLLNLAAPQVPVVERTLLDSWTRTSPTPVPDQAPAPFLHGLDTAPQDVLVLWRADLGTGQPDFDQWAARMRQVPPHSGESVAIPAEQLRRFLTHSPLADDTCDIEGIAPAAQAISKAKQKQPSMSPALRYDEAQNEWTPVLQPQDIRPGATVVLPSHYGGHDAYGWSGTRDLPVADLGDFPSADTAPTRVDACLLSHLAGDDKPLADALTQTVTRAVDVLRAGDPEQTGPTVQTLLDALASAYRGTEGTYARLACGRLSDLRAVTKWTAEPAGRTESRGRVVLDPDEPARLLLIPPRPPAGRTEQGAGVGDDSADASSLTRPVALGQHGQAVGERAAAYSIALDLPAPLIQAEQAAGQCHDSGKEHSRFQCMLCGGDRLLSESLDEPRAKSGMDPADHVARRRAARLAQWAPEMRHEALSALAVTAWLQTQPDHPWGDDEQLLVHLVAAHHGHGRPLLPPVADPAPQEVTCTMPDRQRVTIKSSEMGTDWSGPDRFLALNRRYGPWGLALLEAVLRLADMACSEEGT
ncbi:type I-U CRISPR-associated helicase/endonuclease Cas3 [Streptomyces sp. SPB4]|uniref:type I-G CRISPR-associated helicase/endonuclease Cas3g n=1 Tax=Streptomyces sp. SPB4 TaxID=2940553 RepID=UPI002475FA4F|nr:type I-U CRISPR-associated helicase/endonuclease Cas3 [Streptomyces sp. SPB4]MDH6544122.1 CRISPR-associated endonuclease/helicase Cas3 [Streptomyces sp. SPB4]